MALDATARSRGLWDRMAPRYDRDMRRLEPLLFGRDARPSVCAQARGDVLDVAIGTGLNLPHYPPGARLTGVDLSPVMLAAAAKRAADQAGFTVTDSRRSRAGTVERVRAVKPAP
jgi:SAM-dependent methyltransferase